ncbi:hypothetical protein BDQ17DRAFT_1432860 [Cyathus striatus]|nr:hypothetical protein BDQ17DRAFT_1432860 [Cyathus striatus]
MVSPPKPWERNAAAAASSSLPQTSAPALPSTPSPATQQAGSSGAASSSQQSQIPTVLERPAGFIYLSHHHSHECSLRFLWNFTIPTIRDNLVWREGIKADRAEVHVLLPFPLILHIPTESSQHTLATYAADTCTTTQAFFYVPMEYCGGGNLSTFFEQATKLSRLYTGRHDMALFCADFVGVAALSSSWAWKGFQRWYRGYDRLETYGGYGIGFYGGLASG